MSVANKLKLLNAKKERLFSRIQTIYEHANNINLDSFRELFLCEFETVDGLRSDFESTLDEINMLELKERPEYEVNYQQLSAFEDMYGRIKRVMKQLEPSVSSPAIPVMPHRRAKLPPIELPQFNGDLKSWPLFYSSFKNTIHLNLMLSDAEKLYYLLGRLTGNAQSIFAGIAPSAENYELIYQSLVNKYQDKRMLASSYMDQIFDLKPVGSATAVNLELFLDKFSSSFSAIKRLGIEDLTDFIFLYLALKKLDSETVRAFELDHRSQAIPSFDQLVIFVRDNIKILHQIHPDRKGSHRSDTVNTKAVKSTHVYVNTSSPSSSQRTSEKCTLCNTHHEQLYSCSAFQKLTPVERFRFVKSNNLCLNCFNNNHLAMDCKSKFNCRKCNKKHHSMLHFEPRPFEKNEIGTSRPVRHVETQPKPTVQDVNSTVPSAEIALCSLSSNESNSVDNLAYPQARARTVLLGTARVVVVDNSGGNHIVRVLLDSASQSNFITLSCCQRLGLNNFNKLDCLTVKGIGGFTKVVQGSINLKFFSRLDLNISFDVETLVVDKITECLPTTAVDTSRLSNFTALPLADDAFDVPGEIEMLIGASIFPHLLLSRRVYGHPTNIAPVAMETLLGYVIIGSAPARFDYPTSISCCCVADSMESAVRRFWEIEEVSLPPSLSPDDVACEELYSRTTTRDKDGRYVVALPFKGDVFSLGDSRHIAEKRFYCLERKLRASPNLKLAYDGVIREYLDKGYLSLAPAETETNRGVPSYTIPHHGVIREDKVTTKLRIVLDASAKTSSSLSLNDILYGGQNLQSDLFDVIVNFRLFAVALSADIRQMFLCIGVRERDRRFQRILYRFSSDEPLKVYEFNRVCFGFKSSPFHALRTIKKLVEDEGGLYPNAKTTISTGLYMDDLVCSVDNEAEAIVTTAEVIALMKAGQFDLVKWSSNSQAVLNSIPPSHRLSSVKEFDVTERQKILGLCWSPTNDEFNLNIHTLAETCTKRVILSCVARIWDLMGFVAPVVLYAKLLIKYLWLCNCNWDDAPPPRIIELWTCFREELPLLAQIKIPRYVGIGPKATVTVVGFADASEKAYGGVVYFHVCVDGNNSIFLISSKSKVSPRKVVSVARLELCACLVLAKLIRKIIVACSTRCSVKEVYAFSDSTVSLCWIHSSPHRWDTFVSNRVTKIQADLSADKFYHVSGVDNPADCLSRGLTPAQLLNHPLWFNGPLWVKSDPSQWPVSKFVPSGVTDPPEEKKQTFYVSSSIESLLISLSNRWSSWSKYLRCVVYICRFLKLLPRRYCVSASDLDFAEFMILRQLQNSHFATEVENLKVDKPCSRRLQCLKPFLDNGLIRVGGRLSNAELDYNHKHPIVLPRAGHILNLLVDYHHKMYCHAGPDLLMSILRQKYWIFSARNLIRSRVRKCIPCFRVKPKPVFPEMADHRSCRVVETVKPFIHTGTDYAGPFKVALSRGRGVRSRKAYVCLFVCMTTRAIHIELACDLSTASFMSAFKRFISRRGPVGRIYSDNGTNYIGAKRSLSELDAFLRSKYCNTEFAQVLAENRVTWLLNTPAASHFGGSWEANIKSLKTHLYRVIGDQILSFEEITTVLAQVEAVMNSRPLCRTLSSDPSEPLALTPAHFLNTTPLKYFPAEDITEDRLHLLSRIDLLDKLIQSYWKRWRAEYLHTLQSRQKWNTPSNPVVVGTVVILTTENAPPLHWPLGIVEEVFPGSDGVTRIVKVRTATGSYMRPVVRLCPLPNQ